ncbi:Cys/Met metabolism PLP-dependent enzyme-domain-containing protein [Phellopilus nigrolimitatus]|nr:Cys/Met metabolism PLP-dependent enzyme-domain-containing protein [Phellopilus nigrolimitatus]
MTSSTDSFGTRAVHTASEPSQETGAVIPPISLSTTYAQSAVGVHKGYEYTRSGNPNRDQLETLLASLESGGAYGLAFASGSATTATVLQALGTDAHVLSVNDVYGGTFRYMTKVSNLQTTFLDLENESDEAIYNAIKPNTKLIWIESPTNPTLRLISIERIVAVARSHPANPLVLVDSTFLSPYYQSPLLAGADIVLHSLTKYINGHSDVLMGALVLPARHTELAARLRFLQNAIGAVPGAFDCWLAQRGAKTLHLRMRQHGRGALRVARFLQSRVGHEVRDVVYPGLAGHPRNALAYASLSPHARTWVDGLGDRAEAGGFPYGGMVSFRILPRTASGAPVAEAQGEKTHATAEAFLTSLRLFTLAESLGGVESLAELPSMMTHGSIPPAERANLGIGDDLIRLSCGIEDEEDLVQDVKQALEIAVYGAAVNAKTNGANGVNGYHSLATGGEDTPPLVG